MAKVLVTGLSGFTGHYLGAALREQGHSVYGISQSQHDPANQLLQASLDDASQLQQVLETVRPDRIVHLAAIAFVAHGDTDAMYQTNLMGTQHLLKAIAASGIHPEHVLIASSANIYGNATEEPITEKTALAPVNDYAVSKVAMEYMVRTWMDKLPITIVRPFNYTGVGQAGQFLLPKIVNHFREKKPVIELGNLDVVRDFSDVRDVVTAYTALLQQPAAGETYNVCSGQGTSLLEVIESMKQISGQDIEVRVNPAFVRADEVKRLIGSDARLEAAIGTRDKRALAETLGWMFKH